MFVTGPDVVRAVTNEDVDKETLGGAMTHCATSGVAHFVCRDDEETLMTIRELVGFIPSNNMEDAPAHPVTDEVGRVCHELDGVVPPTRTCLTTSATSSSRCATSSTSSR